MGQRSDLKALREGCLLYLPIPDAEGVEAAVQFEGDIHVTLRPQGGFRGAEMKVC